MSPVERVIELAKAANARIEATFNAPDVLPFASDALEVVRSNPEHQAEFEEVFLNMGGYAPTEFVEVCMHALRWPNVKQGFERSYRQAVDSNDWRAEPVYRHYLEAFEDDWEAEEFYGAFFPDPKPATHDGQLRTFGAAVQVDGHPGRARCPPPSSRGRSGLGKSQMMYFLTVKAGDEIVRERVPFADYAEAVAACGEFYEPRAAGAALNFTTVVREKRFMRSHAQLTRMADLGDDVPRDSPRAMAAAKQSNAFSFWKSCAFLIESEDGIREAERMARED